MALDLVMATEPIIYRVSHGKPCPECFTSLTRHEASYGLWHIPSFSRPGLFHEVMLNVGAITLPECSCEHGRGKGKNAPLRCRHYLVAQSLHRKAYGELVPPDPREPKIARVVESNGIELFDNDEQPVPDKLTALFDTQMT